MSKISTCINNETMLKLKRRAERLGMTPSEAFRKIATKGPEFFFGDVGRCYHERLNSIFHFRLRRGR